jgi:hypothetical protein
MSHNGLVRVHYFGGQQTAELLPAIAGALIANNIAEEIDMDGNPVLSAGAPKQAVAVVQPQAAAVVPHTNTAAMPRPGFQRGPVVNARRTGRNA